MHFWYAVAKQVSFIDTLFSEIDAAYQTMLAGRLV